MQPFNFPLPEVSWDAIMPVAIVTITGILALILEMIRPKHKNDMVVGASLLGLLLAGYTAFVQFGTPAYETFSDTYVRDTFGSVVQLILIAAAFLCILFSEPYLRNKGIAFGEFYPLVLWSTVGAMLMGSTNNLLVLFLGLEILSVSLYVLAGLSRQEEKSEESAMKYFLLGAFASGFLLFGIAFLYGGSGSLHLDRVMLSWTSSGPELRAFTLFGIALMLVGLGFKASLVPFHQWTPDVYQGAPTNVTAFMATAAKVGALAALVRVLEAVSPPALSSIWMPAMVAVAILTMLVGNLVALTQRDVKRILAYSSIAHAGYVLVGILAHAKAPERVSTAGVSFYLMSYAFMTIGAFAVISLTARADGEATTLDDLRGMYRRTPLAAVALVVFMLSLIGLPPTAGFVGKLMIFGDAIRADLMPLAIVLAVSSAISIFYYLSIALAACSSEHDAEPRFAKLSPAVMSACLLCIAGVLGASVFAIPLMKLITDGQGAAGFWR